jgi:type IV pilus assembly protein PilE
VKRSRTSNEEGFTLIELSVVAGIIGILAALAVPSYGSYKSRGVDGAMQASLRNARNAMEGFAVDHADSYVGVDLAALEEHGYSPDGNVTIVVEGVTETSYHLRACARGSSAGSLLYDSSVGRVVSEAGSCS